MYETYHYLHVYAVHIRIEYTDRYLRHVQIRKNRLGVLLFRK